MAQLAVVADDAFQRRQLEAVLVKAHHHVLLSCEAAQLPAGHRDADADPAVWLLLLPAAAVQSTLHYLDSHSRAPALILDDMPADEIARARWFRRLFAKLGRELGEELPEAQPQLAEDVWVLGASLGGPEAIKAFVTALPPDLPIALVYVQHIDECFDQLLVDNLSRYSHYPAAVCREELRLYSGRIAVISPDHKPRFLPFGRVIDSGEPWQGMYRPCIDQVAVGLARLYRERLGLIVFTGTYNDGEQGARNVKALGGTVWAQSPQSCASDTMPRAAMGTGAVSISGSPQQLAAALASRYRDISSKRVL